MACRWIALVLALAACGPVSGSAAAPVPSAPAATLAAADATPSAQPSAQPRTQPSPEPSAPSASAPEPPVPLLSVQIWCAEVGRSGARPRCIAPHDDPPLPATRIAIDDELDDDVV